MRVGFTGTQQGMTEEQYDAVMDLLVELEPTEVHHGDCVGADEEFHGIARCMKRRPKVHIHPPESQSKRARCGGDVSYPVKPYLERNHDIVDVSEVMVATPEQDHEVTRSGTWATIRYACKKGVPVHLVQRNGLVVRR